jgi:hypothetical protein
VGGKFYGGDYIRPLQASGLQLLIDPKATKTGNEDLYGPTCFARQLWWKIFRKKGKTPGNWFYEYGKGGETGSRILNPGFSVVT